MAFVMRLGVIADIHADLDGLERAIQLLNRISVDQIVCAGDLVEKGPDGDAVVDYVRQHGILTVAGNHDVAAVRHQDWLRRTVHVMAVPMYEYLLSDESIAFLGALPLTRLIPCGSYQALLAHGTPWDNQTYAFPGSYLRTYQRIAAEARAAESDIVILGHTHIPMAGEFEGIRILNPGSVCKTRASGSGTCAVLTVPGFNFQVYDIYTGETVRTSRVMESYLPREEDLS